MNKKVYLLASLLIFAAGCSDDNTDSGRVDEPIPGGVVCGNAVVEDGEMCDDGNTVDGDGCSADCKVIEENYSCPEKGGKCSIKGQNPPVPGPENDAVCGNGSIEDGEKCDDGNVNDGDGCSADCQTIEENYHCSVPGYACALDSCGDGIQNEGEDCDDGDLNQDYGQIGGCSTSCHLAHYCGDGLLDKIDIDNGEECDAGSDTSSDYNGCTEDCRRVNFCGDGIIQPENEQCDDGNAMDGDGCSALCQIEENYACKTIGEKSVCIQILCGNGKLDATEVCDDGNRISGDGCSASCTQENGYLCTQNANGLSECKSAVGDGIVSPEAGEECDDANANPGDGCSDNGRIEPGWICPEVGKPCIAKACGDGILAGNEECDDGNAEDNDGCSYRCKVENGWLCDNTGNNCHKGRCGDGIVQVGEACDNDVVASGKPVSGDGCSDTCKIEAGYECKIEGGECHKTTCGDGNIKPQAGYVSYEECDLGMDANGASLNDGNHGCSESCTIITGYHCDTNGQNCEAGVCGDNKLDAGEECDDGNRAPADGCSPDCKRESGIECSNGQCKPICGDGVTMWMLDKSIAEECDDGNLTNGDGCSSDCKIERGFTCTEFTAAATPYISLPITYRDFRSDNLEYLDNADSATEEQADGFITSAKILRYPEAGWTQALVGKPLPDFNYQAGCLDTGYTLDELDADAKPVLNPNGSGTTTPTYNGKMCFYSAGQFAMWYRNTPGINREVKSKLHLWLNNAQTNEYYFTSNAPTTNGAPNVCADGRTMETSCFVPISTEGYGLTPGYENQYRNYSFTSEVSTYFQYKGGESLVFSGDDDLWVFLNGRLFVDLGGLHGEVSKTGTLAMDSCEIVDANGNKKTVTCDKKYEVYENGVYEMKLFHAERNATGSNFSLTLTNFLNSGTAECSAICGDGVVRAGEECDYVGIDTNVELQHEKGCSSTCKLQPYCGNGKIETGEQCDTNEEWCVNCMLSPNTCGNGQLDAHEECDGTAGVSAGQVCLPTCRISGCGDGVLDKANNEECDDGNTSDDDMCTSKCTIPYCGDGIVTPFLGEVCDDGAEGNDGAYGHCGLGCTYMAPACGDGIVDKSAGEECDDGKDRNIGGYGRCKNDCKYDIRCGDGIVQSEFEQCDDPNDLGCSKSCTIVIN